MTSLAITNPAVRRLAVRSLQRDQASTFVIFLSTVIPLTVVIYYSIWQATFGGGGMDARIATGFDGIYYMLSAAMVAGSVWLTRVNRDIQHAAVATVNGATKRHLGAITVAQSLLVSAVASVVAVVLAFGLGVMSIESTVVFSDFGFLTWTDDFSQPFRGLQVDVPSVLIAIAVVTLVSAVAAWWPARQMATLSLGAALHGRLPTPSRKGRAKLLAVAIGIGVSSLIGLRMLVASSIEELSYGQYVAWSVLLNLSSLAGLVGMAGLAAAGLLVVAQLTKIRSPLLRWIARDWTRNLVRVGAGTAAMAVVVNAVFSRLLSDAHLRADPIGASGGTFPGLLNGEDPLFGNLAYLGVSAVVFVVVAAALSWLTSRDVEGELANMVAMGAPLQIRRNYLALYAGMQATVALVVGAVASALQYAMINPEGFGGLTLPVLRVLIPVLMLPIFIAFAVGAVARPARHVRVFD